MPWDDRRAHTRFTLPKDVPGAIERQDGETRLTGYVRDISQGGARLHVCDSMGSGATGFGEKVVLEVFFKGRLFKRDGVIFSRREKNVGVKFGYPLSIQEIDLFAPCEVGETQQIGSQLKIVGPLNDSTKRPVIEAARFYRNKACIDLSKVTMVDDIGGGVAHLLIDFGALIRNCSPAAKVALSANGVCRRCTATCDESKQAKAAEICEM